MVETLVAFSFCSAHHCNAMNAARERINLALKILSSRHDAQKHVSATDVHTLKSCVRGDVTGRSVYEMATAVIRAELVGSNVKLEPKRVTVARSHRRSGAAHREKKKGAIMARE